MEPGETGESNVSSSLRRIGEFSYASFLITLIRFGVRLVKSIVFTRLLGPVERGVFGLLTTIPDLIISLGNLGFGIGNVYLVAHKQYDLRKIVGNTLLATFLLGACLAGVGYVIFSFKGILRGDSATLAAYAPLVLAMTPFLLLHKFGEDLLAAMQEIHFLNKMGLLLSLLPGVFLVVLWLVTGDPLLSAMYAWAIGFLIVSVWSLAKVASRHRYEMSVSMAYFKEAFSFGGRGLIGIFAGIFVRKVDVLFVSAMQGAEALGYYAVSVSVAEILISIQSAVTTPFLPIRLGLEKQDALIVTPIVIRHALFITAVISIGVAAGGQLLILVLFGKAFLPAYSAVVWLLPGILALSAHDILKFDLYSHNLPEFVSWAAAGSLVCNIALNFLLIPPYGINGAAISSSISYGLATLILLQRFHTLTGTPYKEILIIKKSELKQMGAKIRKIFA